MKNKKIILEIITPLLVIFVAFDIAYYEYRSSNNIGSEGGSVALPVKDDNSKLGQYVNKQYGVKLIYPEAWYFKETKGGEKTPFGVLFSSIDLDEFTASPQKGYPDKYINLVFYKTDETELDYANSQSSRFTNIYSETLATKSGSIKLYDGFDSNNRKYMSAYKKSGEYIVILETHVVDKTDEIAVDGIFRSVLSSLELENANREFAKLDTSKWIEYINNKHGYVIKYPNVFLGGETDLNTDRAYFYSTSRDFQGGSSYLSVEVIVSAISIDDWWSQYDSKDAVKYELRDELNIEGVPSKRYKGLSGMYSDHLVLKKDGKIYHLSGISNENMFIEFINTFAIN